jgi:Domain of unknown function (DUF4397)
VKKIGIILSSLLALAMLQGCSKSADSSSGSSQSTVRLVNATIDYASLDLIASSTTLASGVATGSASSYATIDSGATTFSVERGGSGTPSAQTTLTLSKDVDYTLLAYTSGQKLQVTSLTGNGKIRVSNLSSDGGSMDVYMMGDGGTLSAASTLANSVGGTTGYFEVNKGTYHVWVTTAGDKTDLRLDLPSIAISDKQVLTLVLTSAVGGVLVDGFLVTQKGEVSARKNGSARVRLAANITANGSIDATANGVSLGSASRSVGSYTLVPAGTLSVSVVVNGNTVNAGNLNAEGGADLTLLAVGDGASPRFFLLNDDNRRPVSGVKLRLVNGINGLGDNISLTADYNLIAHDVAPGTASAAASVSSGTISLMEVNSSQANTSLYRATDVSLQSLGVYSLFMLGNNAAPTGILRRDR